MKIRNVGGENGFPKKPAPDAAIYLAENAEKLQVIIQGEQDED